MPNVIRPKFFAYSPTDGERPEVVHLTEPAGQDSYIRADLPAPFWNLLPNGLVDDLKALRAMALSPENLALPEEERVTQQLIEPAGITVNLPADWELSPPSRKLVDGRLLSSVYFNAPGTRPQPRKLTMTREELRARLAAAQAERTPAQAGTRS